MCPALVPLSDVRENRHDVCTSLMGILNDNEWYRAMNDSFVRRREKSDFVLSGQSAME
jgi:hypothetical protein